MKVLDRIFEWLEWDEKFAFVFNWCYLAATIIALFLGILVIKGIWPDSIPFGMFEFWKGSRVWEGIKAVWWVFIWGAGITALHSAFTRNSREEDFKAESLFAFETLESIFAGVLEEIKFRWLAFFAAIVVAKVSNFLFFGWMGFGLVEWIFLNITGPIINFLTLNKMSWLLFHPAGWFVGAAALAANAKFQEGHRYLGFFGYFNS